MPEPIRLLVLSKDETLFADGDAVQGDARRRHIRYAQELRAVHGPDSEIRIITYTRRGSGHRRDDPAPGLKLYGTNSIHRASYMAGVCALLPAALADGWRPTAITVQTPWEEGFIGLLAAVALKCGFVPQLHFDLLSTSWRREKPLNPLLQILALQVLRASSRIRVVSSALKVNIAGRLGIDSGIIDVIPVGVNFEPSGLPAAEARRRIDPRIADHPVVLFVGRLTPSKDLRLWLDVAADVLASAPETRFLIVGDGEQADELRSIIAGRGLADQIIMTGAIGHERLPAVYAAADIFLLTSSHEGFGRVVLEAALAGVPSISTRCSGPADIIEDGETGLIVEIGDRPALVAATLQLLRDPVKRQVMGQSARRAVENRFGLDALASLLVQHWSRA